MARHKSIAALNGLTLVLVLTLNALATDAPAQGIDSSRIGMGRGIERASIIPTFAAAGDSITAWPGSAGQALALTWPTAVVAAKFSGEGWANSGANSTEVAANMPAVDSGVLVIMVGTNDLVAGTSTAVTIANIYKIAIASGAPRILLCAVAPFGTQPAKSNALNAAIKAFAASTRWGYVDPWTTSRDTDSTFIDELTVDGYHPTGVGEQRAAAIIGRAITLLAVGEITY